LALVSVIVFSLLFLLLADCCRIFVARSISRKAADAAVLAVSQDLLFLEKHNAVNTAQKVAVKNGCILKEFNVSYDKVIISVEKNFDFIFPGFLGKKNCSVTSVSEAGITYPWDEALGLCSSYRFDYIK